MSLATAVLCYLRGNRLRGFQRGVFSWTNFTLREVFVVKCVLVALSFACNRIGQLKTLKQRVTKKMAVDTQSWLNADFVEKVLKKSENDESIHVTNIITKPATNVGDNYTSDMIRVTAEFSRQRGGRKTTEKKSVIVKVSPTAEGSRKDMVEKSEIFTSETRMMMDTLNRMNQLLGPELPPLNGRGLYAQEPPKSPTLIVIEDLAPLGYRMADREAGLDLAHCMLAVQGLSRFHASSVAVCEQDPNHKRLYKKGIFSEEHGADLRAFFLLGTKSLAHEVESWPELGPKYSEKIMKLSEKIYDKGIAAAVCHENEFNVINHGDVWCNNMLFRYDDHGKPVGHIFVDFQLPCYTSPAVDLLYFFNTSLTDEIYETKQDQLLEEYIRVLSATMKKLKCKTAPPTMQEVKSQMAQREAYGMAASFTILPVVTIDKKEARDLQEIMTSYNDGDFSNPAYKGSRYRKMITKRILKYDELGLLD